ncbi:WD40 repeat domain-containing protein [Carboxylicivirga sp. N1Y90]|uniref:WD40 repeat domain-containing protein n=1 Tax=Carboxylicivirga fragile TaxID=3417571 RepID=UPI003D344D61|nr:WD40 repeat domain-containing protein [Marinilabiliaceae bacterium N1Y90]
MQKQLLTTLVVLLFNAIVPFAQEDEYLKEVIYECDFETNCIAVSEDNKTMLIGGDNKTVTLLDLTTKKVLFETLAHYQPVIEVHFSKKHNGFYTVGDKSFKLWIDNADKPEKIYKGSHTSITDWDMSANEDFFVGGSYEKRFRCWNETELATPETVTTTHEKSVISIALSNNKELIASGSLDNTIKIWSADSLQHMQSIDAHSKPVCCLYFVDDTYLVSASHDGLAYLWNIKTGERKVIYDGHTKAISDIDISPNGKYLLTAAHDNTINLYAIATGDHIHRYKYHEAAVLDVKWSAKGDEFYACDKNGKIALWSLSPKVFVDYYFGSEMAKEVYGNTLFKPRKQGESKTEYKARQAKAEAFQEKQVDAYHKKYLDLLKTQTIED